METFGQRLVFAREQRNFTQKDLASKLGITPTRLNYWEKDKREPAIAMIKALAQILNVDTDFLIGLRDSAQEKKEIPPSTTEAAQGEGEITMEESDRLLVALGLIEEGQELSDDDLAFLTHIVGLLEAWFSRIE